jgi:hypothetical protein
MFDQTVKSRRGGALAGAALAAALVLLQLPVGAVTDEERAGARAAATEGARAYQERRWADSVDLFTRAESLVHSPVHLLYIARSRAQLGQLVEAREYYLKVTRENIAADSPAAFLQAKQDAQTELASLEPRLAYITVSVQGRSPNEVTVTMDGKVVPPALVGVPRPVNPGEHAFQAGAQGQQSSVTKVSVKEGGRETVVLTLEDAQPAAASTAPATAAPAADSGQPSAPVAGPAGAPGGPAPPADAGVQPETGEGPNWMRIGSYASLGVGAIGLGMGIGFLVQKGAKRDDADALYALWQENCPGHRDCAASQERINELDDEADSAGTLSTVGFIVAGLGVAGGVTLFILSMDGGQAETASSTPVCYPWVGPGSVGVLGKF